MNAPDRHLSLNHLPVVGVLFATLLLTFAGTSTAPKAHH